MQLDRRTFLGGAGTALALSLAGCSKNVPDDAVEALPTPTLGAANAPATIEVFEDFGCPHCKRFNEQVKPKLIENYTSTGKAKIEFHDYPMPVSEFSWPAAMCARSVQDRAGEEAFWQYAGFVFDNQSSLGWKLLREAANELDLDGAAVVADAKNNKYRPVVQKSHDDGQARGVQGTPTVFVAGEIVTPPKGGTYSDYYQAIAQAVEQNQ